MAEFDLSVLNQQQDEQPTFNLDAVREDFQQRQEQQDPLGDSWEQTKGVTADQNINYLNQWQKTGVQPPDPRMPQPQGLKPDTEDIPRKELDDINKDAPVARRWLSDPRNMAVAKTPETLKQVYDTDRNMARTAAKFVKGAFGVMRQQTGAEYNPLNPMTMMDLVAGGQGPESVASGLVGAAGNMVSAIDWLFKSQVARNVAGGMRDFAGEVMPQDATFRQELTSGVGSFATFFVPGMGVAGTASRVASVAPRVAAYLGLGTITVMEAATEAGGVYQQMVDQGYREKDASSAASKTFWWNIPLLVITNKIGYFTEMGGALQRAASAFISEGTQEAVQEYISSNALNEDITMAQLAKVFVIGGIIGAGAGGALGAMQQGEVAEPQQQPEVKEILDAVEKSVKESDLNTKIPDASAALIKKALVENGLPSQLYVDAGQVLELFQGPNFEQDMADYKNMLDAFNWKDEDVRAAAAAGSDMALDLDRLGYIVEHPAWPTLKNFVRALPLEEVRVVQNLIDKFPWEQDPQQLELPEPEMKAFEQRLVAAGANPDAALATAQVVGAVSKVWSQNTGQMPADFFAKYKFGAEKGQMLTQAKDPITKAYTELSGGESDRVYLKDLRAKLPKMAKARFDKKMLDLQNEGKLVLMPLDDPTRITPEDEAAAIDILGNKRHIVYMDMAVQAMEQNKGPRGAMTLDTNTGAAVIRLFEDADNSTPLHEVGHIFRQVLKDMAAMEGASEQIKADWETAKAFVGATGEGFWTSQQEEKWAKAWETYFYEGTAPEPQLQSVFDRFAKWLYQIYLDVRNIGVNLSPDMKMVFGRLLAGEKAVMTNPYWADMGEEQFFLTAEGTPEGDFETWNRLQKSVQDKIDAAIRAKRESEISELRRVWKKEAEDTYNNLPVTTAIAQIKSNGGLNLDLLKADWDAASVLSISRKWKKVVLKDGRNSLDSIATVVGYGDGDALMQDLMDTPSKRDFVRKYIMDNEDFWQGQGAMFEDAIPDEYEDYQRLVSETIAEQFGAKIQPRSAQGLKSYILREYGGKPVEKMVKESVALRAAMQKASRAAREAYRAGKKETALEWQEKKRLAIAKLKAIANARKVRDDSKRFFRAVLKQAIKPVTAKGGIYWDHIQQVRQLLERFQGNNMKSARSAAGIPSLRQFMTDRAKLGEIYTIPDHIVDGPGKPFKDMTVDEMLELRNAVEQLVYNGREQQKALYARYKENIRERAEKLFAQAMKYRKAKGPTKIDEAKRKAGLLDQQLDEVRQFKAELLTTETICRILDGKDFGDFYMTLFDPLKRAEDAELRWGGKVAGEISALFRKLPDKVKRSLGKKVLIPGLQLESGQTALKTSTSLTGEERLAVALNSGTEQGWYALTQGWGWTDEQVQTILNSMSQEEWEYVRGVWDVVNSLFDRADATHLKATGTRMKKVEGRKIDTPYGQIDGQYYPLKYDRRVSDKVDRIESLRETRDPFVTEYHPVTVERGFTLERKWAPYPPLLDLNVVSKHVNDVIHWTTHVLAIRDVRKVLADPMFKQGVVRTLGDRVYGELTPWLDEIARPNRGALTALDRIAQRIRKNTTMVQLGVRASVIMVQGVAFTQALNRVGYLAGLKGVTAYFSNPWKVEAAINKLSPTVLNRGLHYERDLAGHLSRYQATPKNFKEAVQQTAFYLIQWTDKRVAYMAWLSAYHAGMAKSQDHAKAVDYADMVVRRTQASAAPKDMAGILRGREAKKLFSMYYTFMSSYYQESVVAKEDLLGRKISFPEFLHAHWLLTVLPALVAFAIRRRRLPEGDEALKEIANYYLGKVPVVRDFLAVITTGYAGDISPAQDAYSSLAELWRTLDADKIDGQKVFNAAVKTAGYATGLVPSEQLITFMDGAVDLWNGDTTNPWRLFMRERRDDKKRRQKSRGME